MAKIISKPTQVEAAGQPPKIIREFIGQVNTKTSDISIAHMTSPSGWSEPGQTPEFDEYTFVMNGELVVKTKTEQLAVRTGQVVFAPKGEWVQYSTPGSKGAQYLAICIPAFSPDKVHRDE